MKRKAKFNFLTFFLIIFIGVACFFIFSLAVFERNSPKISLPSEVFSNLQSPIVLHVSDDESAIKSIKVYLTDGLDTKILSENTFSTPVHSLDLNVSLTQNMGLDLQKNYFIVVEATDNSKWNFFMGNTAKAQAALKIDTIRPELYILDQSYKIQRGGSAVVVFRATDPNLQEVYVQTNYGKKFHATPFYKDGYYASLVAWPSTNDSFSAHIVAIDKANNVSRTRVRYFLQDRQYKTSKITVTDKFLDGKIANLTDRYAKDPDSMDKVAKLKFVNEALRAVNEEKIATITSKVPEKSINNFFVKPFYPLRNGSAVASFADHRYYVYQNKEISEGWHLGLDLASTAKAPIISTNSAIVVFNEENGIYGKNVILYHGFGLYTLYGHCSDTFVNVADVIKPSQIIANTGTTGLALGDHLHFGVLVQGIEVRPEEWMDKKWMQENIYDILQTAKKVIDNK